MRKVLTFGDTYHVGYVEELRRLVGHRPLILASAGALILDAQGRILLQRRSDNGLWGIPGGAMEPGESLEETARREIREETGLEVGELSLMGIFSGPQFFYQYPNGDQVYNVMTIYITGTSGGEPIADPAESLEVSFFAADNLPATISPPVIPVLQAYLAHLSG